MEHLGLVRTLMIPQNSFQLPQSSDHFFSRWGSCFFLPFIENPPPHTKMFWNFFVPCCKWVLHCFPRRQGGLLGSIWSPPTVSPAGLSHICSVPTFMLCLLKTTRGIFNCSTYSPHITFRLKRWKDLSFFFTQDLSYFSLKIVDIETSAQLFDLVCDCLVSSSKRRMTANLPF